VAKSSYQSSVRSNRQCHPGDLLRALHPIYYNPIVTTVAEIRVKPEHILRQHVAPKVRECKTEFFYTPTYPLHIARLSPHEVLTLGHSSHSSYKAAQNSRTLQFSGSVATIWSAGHCQDHLPSSSLARWFSPGDHVSRLKVMRLKRSLPASLKACEAWNQTQSGFHNGSPIART